MMHIRVFLLYVPLVLSAVQSSELQDAFKDKNVNKTIARVEAILARNPALPRLTRGEILALFENVTKNDNLKTKSLSSLMSSVDEKSPPDKGSVMVVLPYRADSNQSEDLEELYTKRPVTRIVGVDYTTTTVSTTTSTTAKPKRMKKRKNGTRRKPPNEELRPVYISDTTPTVVPSKDESQWKPMIEISTETPTKSPNKHSEIKVPEYMQGTLDTFQNSNNQIFVTVPPQSPTTKVRTTEAPSTTPATNITIAAQSLTPELKNLLVSLGLLNPDGTQTTTTTTSTHSPQPLIQYISISPTVDPTSYIVFKPLPLASRGNQRGKEENLSDDMREFLARFGLTADTLSFRSQKALTTDTQMSSASATTEETTTPSVNSVSTTTKVENEDLKINLNLPNFNTDILTDDMRETLENMGLMDTHMDSKRNPKRVIFSPATAGALKESEKEKVSKLLSSIKHLTEAEKNKSLSADQVAEQLQNITASLVEENKEDESNLELVEGESSETSYEGYEPAEEELLKLQNGFVDEELKDDFPLEDAVSDTNNRYNNHLNSDILPDMAIKNKQSLINSFNPPDPLSQDELNHFVENGKNEVKRQQPNKPEETQNSTESSKETSSTTQSDIFDLNFDEPKSNANVSSDAPPSASDSTITSTDSAASAAGEASDSTPSQDDLIDSFGGDNPPPSRPNGLYFLVDWNTFLRVGTDNRTVDLNFSPKVGDPKNFIPVTVP